MVHLFGFFGYESTKHFSLLTGKMVVSVLSRCELFLYEANHCFNLVLNRT